MKWSILAVILLCSGCVGLSPALTGKTKYTMNFEDVLGETKASDGSVTSPGQTTKFSVDIAAAAGVEDLKELASMKYHVTPEGKVEIDVASSSQMDTTGQAAALVQVHESTVQAIKEVAPVITEAVTKSVLQSLGIPALESAAEDSKTPLPIDVFIAELAKHGIHIDRARAAQFAASIGVPLILPPE